MMTETEKNIRVCWAINNAVQIAIPKAKDGLDIEIIVKNWTIWFLEYFDEAHEILEQKLLTTIPVNIPIKVHKAETKYQRLVESKGLDGGSMKGEVYKPPTNKV